MDLNPWSDIAYHIRTVRSAMVDWWNISSIFIKMYYIHLTEIFVIYLS